MRPRKPLVLNSPNGMQVEFIAAGGWGSKMESQSLAGTISGDIYGWGCNAKGQLGKYVIDLRQDERRETLLRCLAKEKKSKAYTSIFYLVPLLSRLHDVQRRVVRHQLETLANQQHLLGWPQGISFWTRFYPLEDKPGHDSLCRIWIGLVRTAW